MTKTKKISRTQTPESPKCHVGPNPLECAERLGHKKAVLGRVKLWDSKEGYNRGVWCCRCRATGEISCNFINGGKYDGILLPGQLPKSVTSSKHYRGPK